MGAGKFAPPVSDLSRPNLIALDVAAYPAPLHGLALDSVGAIPPQPIGLTLSRGYGIFNVLNYGAKGDGITNDAPYIQAAINACAAAGGGTVYFPVGTYLCAVTGTSSGLCALGARLYSLGLPDSLHGNITFQGAGAGVSILKKTTLGGTADYALLLALGLTGYNASWFVFRDLGFDGAQSAANTPFTSGDEHLLMTTNWYHTRVERCLFQNNRGGGIYASSPLDWVIESSYFTGLQWNSTNNSITFDHSAYGAQPYLGGCNVLNNTFVNNQQIDVHFGGSTSSPLEQGTIAFNHFIHDVQTDALSIELVANSSSMYSRSIHIVENDHYGGSGLAVSGKSFSVRGDNYYNMNRGSGLGNAIQLNAGSFTDTVTITGVTIDTCTNFGIDVSGTDILIADCKITGCATGIRVGGGTGGAATRAEVRGNDLHGNTTPITDNGTGTVRYGNRLTTGSLAGRATLVGSTVTVTTAEVQAADNILLTTDATGGTPGHVYVSAIVAGTSFTIASNPPLTRSVYGQVDGAGNIEVGAGLFTVSRTSAGHYTITFASTFATGVGVTVDPVGAAGNVAVLDASVSNNGTTIGLITNGGADQRFIFVAVGPSAADTSTVYWKIVH